MTDRVKLAVELDVTAVHDLRLTSRYLLDQTDTPQDYPYQTPPLLRRFRHLQNQEVLLPLPKVTNRVTFIEHQMNM